MSIVTPPAPLPLRNVKWRLPPAAQVNRSRWTGTSKSVGLPGAQNWTVSGELVLKVGEAQARAWRAFFVQVSQPFRAFAVRAVEGRQTAAGNPTIGAGANAGTTMPVSGLPASQTVLGTGCFLTVPLPSGHRRLVCLTAPLNSNAAGQAVATFEPELTEVPAPGATVEMQWPYALVRLAGDPAGWDVAPGQQYAFAFSAEEAR